MSSAPIPDAAILPPRLDAALTRFERGLAALETAVAQRLENEMSLADLEEELAVMQDDRGRLALDLDAALARAATVEKPATKFCAGSNGPAPASLPCSASRRRATNRAGLMAVAIVTIAGRSYRLGCDEGQEKRLEELAASVDGKIAAMRSNVGEIGDQRLVVMAAIEIADEAADARAKIETLEAEVASLREKIDAGQRRDAAIEARLAKSFDAAATRLERLAQQLAGDIGESDSPL